MRNQIVLLAIVVGLFQLANCKCSTGFELDCFYEAFLGEDSSEERSSKGDDSLSSAISKLTTTLQSSQHGHGDHHASDSLDKDALANLNQIPTIISHLDKLTNALTGVHKKLSKQHSKKDLKSSDEKTSKNSSNSSNSKEDEHFKGEKSPSVENDVKKLKEENANKTNEISKLSDALKELMNRIEKVEKHGGNQSGNDNMTDPSLAEKDTDKSDPKKDE